jgi:EpsI family protein
MTLVHKGFLLLILMIAASVLSVAMRPTHKVANQGPKFVLEEMIPDQFGDWKIDPVMMPIQVSPDVQAQLDKIYNQTLARTYINSRGERIMLSIAYGGDQTDSLSVHLPEGCYGGQGFAIQEKSSGYLHTLFGGISVARLVATKGSRVEPITYWIVSAGKASGSAWEIKLAKMTYSLRGSVPDGMLIRISSISGDSKDAYALQSQFSEAMLLSLTPENRKRMIGSAGPKE